MHDQHTQLLVIRSHVCSWWSSKLFSTKRRI